MKLNCEVEEFFEATTVEFESMEKDVNTGKKVKAKVNKTLVYCKDVEAFVVFIKNKRGYIFHLVYYNLFNLTHFVRKELSDEKTNRTHLTCKEMGVILIFIITTLLIAHIKYEYFILYAI